MKITKAHRVSAINTKSVDLLREFSLGIDLSEKFLDVKKLFLAGFGKKVVQRGFDPEDVLQEVYKGLLVRNYGKCPWDKNKATMGYYVHMVSSNILSNYTRKRDRVKSNEVVGWRGPDGEFHDVAESSLSRDRQKPIDESSTRDLSRWVIENVDLDYASKLRLKQILPLLIEGHTKREISRRVGLKNREVESLLVAVREIYTPCSVV